jgi:glycerol kinase
MAQNGLLLQRLADILDLPILRPKLAESTAFGAACLAAIGCGMFRSLQDVAALWQPELRCEPQLDRALRQQQLMGWRDAVARTRTKG